MPQFIDRKWLVRDGNLTDVVINFIKHQKGEFELILKKRKKQRSKAFNRYYWLYLKIVRQDTGQGETDDELHEMFKRLFLEPKEITSFGKTIRIPGSTTDLDNIGFDEYIKKIEELTGVPAPNPDEYYY